MTLRIPMAFRWLTIGMLGWIGLRAPIVARDFANFRPALFRDALSRTVLPDTVPAAAGYDGHAAALRQTVHARHIIDHGRPRAIAAHMAPASPQAPAAGTPPGMIVIDLPPASPAQAMPARDAGAIPGSGPYYAEHGYRQLRLGDRKRAAVLLAAAVEAAPDDPRAYAWAADLQVLTRRWSGGGYVIARRGSTPSLAAVATPTLGGSQAGARLAYLLNPLADQRITLSGRVFQPLARRSGRGTAAQAVMGLELQPSRALPLVIAIDRYAALGSKARNAWALRLSGGAEGLPVGRGLEASFYGQAGLIGLHARDGYADGWLKVQAPLMDKGGVRALAGAAVWAGAQPGASRVDIGPTAGLSARIGRARVGATVDYRIRTAGNARPGNGPAISVQAGF